VEPAGLETSTQNSDAIFDLNRAAAASASQASATTTEAVTHSQRPWLTRNSKHSETRKTLWQISPTPREESSSVTPMISTPFKKLAEDTRPTTRSAYPGNQKLRRLLHKSSSKLVRSTCEYNPGPAILPFLGSKRHHEPASCYEVPCLCSCSTSFPTISRSNPRDAFPWRDDQPCTFWLLCPLRT